MKDQQISKQFDPELVKISTSSTSKLKWSSTARQAFASIAANLGGLSVGCLFSWTATALPSLKEENLFAITKKDEAWISSIIYIGGLLSCPVVGFMLDRFGRRLSILLSTLPIIVGWLLIAFAQDLEMIYAGRFIAGLFCGVVGSVAPVFIAELSEKNLRGILTVGFDPALAAGMLYIFVIGSFTSWRIQALACLIPPILSHILLVFVPESPRYLLVQGRALEAEKALFWFRQGQDPQVIAEEFKEMVYHIESMNTNKTSNTQWKAFFSMNVIKPTLIGMALFFFHQATGNYAILAFTVDIFRTAGANDEYLSTTIVGIAQMVGAIAPIFLIELFGRRFLLITSEITSALALFIFGLYFYLKSAFGVQFVETNVGWLPLTILIAYELAFSIGIGPIPYLLLGELSSPKATGFSASLMTTTVRITGFGVLYSFNALMDYFGQALGYWFYSLLCALGAVFVYFIVPETKGKTLEEIHSGFSKKKEQIERL